MLDLPCAWFDNSESSHTSPRFHEFSSTLLPNNFKHFNPILLVISIQIPTLKKTKKVKKQQFDLQKINKTESKQKSKQKKEKMNRKILQK